MFSVLVNDVRVDLQFRRTSILYAVRFVLLCLLSCTVGAGYAQSSTVVAAYSIDTVRHSSEIAVIKTGSVPAVQTAADATVQMAQPASATSSGTTLSSDEPSDDDASFAQDPSFNAQPLTDKFENFNRRMFKLNKALQHKLLNPGASLYDRTLNKSSIRTAVFNFFHNLAEPNDALNAIMQFNIKGFFIASTRFMLNSTLGMLGVRDFAAEHGVRSVSTGFGETLAFYKIPPGPYLVLPIIGPTTVREGIGTIADWFRDPVDFVLVKDGQSGWAYAHLVGGFLTTYADQIMGVSNSIDSISLDEYSMMRSMYSQSLANRKTLKQLVDDALSHGSERG